MACRPSTPREWLVRPGWVVVSSPSFVECHTPSFVGCRPRHSSSVVPVIRQVSSPCHSSSVVPCRLSGVVPVVCRVSSSVICHHSTCGLPHEQLLVRLGVGGASSSVVRRCCPQSFVVPRSFVVCRPLGHSSSSSSYGPGAPTIHPTSSCSSAWGWVLC
jgi:hypothetical protein